jgi:hypothetical protein
VIITQRVAVESLVSLLCENQWKKQGRSKTMTEASLDNSGSRDRKSQSSLSIFRLNKLECLVAVLTSIAAWVGFRSYLQGILPYGCNDYIGDERIPCHWTYQESWTVLGRSLFSSFSIPIVLILAVSAVFLLRAIRRDEGYFSTLGNLALAWPLISFPLANLFSFFGFYCLTIGVGVALIGGLKSLITKRNSGDWIALLFSIAWLWLLLIYMAQWWNRYGD